MTVKVTYFDPNEDAAPSPPYSSGDAGLVWLDEHGFVQSDARFTVSPNSLHSLHAHGVVSSLNALHLDVGPVGTGRDAVVSPASATEAMTIFYDADRMTYGLTHDLLVAEVCEFEQVVQYRLIVDNREYQRTLSKLQFLATTASRHGHGIRLRI